MGIDGHQAMGIDGHQASSPPPSDDIKNPSGAFDSSCKIRGGTLSAQSGNFKFQRVKLGHKVCPNQWSARHLGENEKGG